MAVKTINYTNDRYIEAADTRAQIAALLRNGGYGFKGNITRVGSTNTYTVAAGSVVFIGGLCVRVLTDEAFDLTSDRFIVVDTIYTSLTDGYTCTLKSVTTVDASLQGGMVKQFAIYDKTVGIINPLLNVEDNINLIQDSLIDFVKKSKVSINYYVGKTGNDSNDGLTPASRFLTIQKAIDVLPQVINHQVNIYISTGSYLEDVTVQGFSGSGSINIYDENGQVQVNCFSFYQCSIYLKVSGNFLILNKRIAVYRCNYIWLYGFTSTFSSTSEFGLYVVSTTYCLFENASIANKTNAIVCSQGSTVHLKNVGGSNNVNAITSNGGSKVIFVDTNTIVGTTKLSYSTGGDIIQKNVGYSLETTGYDIYSNGSIKQWGVVTTTGVGTNDMYKGMYRKSIPITLPIAFPAKCIFSIASSLSGLPTGVSISISDGTLTIMNPVSYANNEGETIKWEALGR